MVADKMPCQWRSCHGNSYAVVKDSDCRVQEEEKAKLVSELGETGYEQKLTDDKAARLAAQQAEEQKRARQRAIDALVSAAETLAETIGATIGNGNIPSASCGQTESKAVVKEVFGFKDSELTKSGTKVKRCLLFRASVLTFLF
jgi:hypothetical protein